MKTLLTTIAVGPGYTPRLDRFSRSRSEVSAARHGCGMLVAQEKIDALVPGKLPPQKHCLHDLPAVSASFQEALPDPDPFRDQAALNRTLRRDIRLEIIDRLQALQGR